MLRNSAVSPHLGLMITLVAYLSTVDLSKFELRNLGQLNITIWINNTGGGWVNTSELM
jgi:hypothetical protein